LQTKKRYVGYKYESPDQKEPEYEAKGIETVRRDGVPAVCKILEKSLRLVFETKDLSVLKRYVQSQMSKLLTGRVNIADLTFAKEFRGMDGYKVGV
jgi:DNA polymerase zeta